MYLEHFGIKELPFSLTPNTEFFLNMASYHKAYNMLMVSIANKEGFIKVVGEVGTGKTMLCRKVLNTLTRGVTVVAFFCLVVSAPRIVSTASCSAAAGVMPSTWLARDRRTTRFSTA